MKNPAKRVAFVSCPLRVAVITMRPLAARLLINSPLALAMLKTTTRRVGSDESSTLYSDAERSGPTKLNFASFPSNDPCPMRNTNNTLFASSRDFSSVNVFLTSSAVALGVVFSDSTRMFLPSNPNFSVSAERNCPVHSSNCCVYAASPPGPSMITANLFGSIGFFCAGTTAGSHKKAHKAQKKKTYVPFVPFCGMSSGQSFAFPQKPLRAQQSDDQHKIHRHVPQVFRHTLGIRRLPVDQIVQQRLRFPGRVILPASLGRDSLQQLVILRRTVILAIPIAHQHVRSRAQRPETGARSQQFDPVLAQFIRLEFPNVSIHRIERRKLQRHIDRPARRFCHSRSRMCIGYGIEMLVANISDDRNFI